MIKPRKGRKHLGWHLGWRPEPKPGQNAPNGDPVVSLHQHCKKHSVDFLMTYEWDKAKGLYIQVGHREIESRIQGHAKRLGPNTPNVPQALPVDTAHLVFTCPYCGLSDEENYILACHHCGRDVCTGAVIKRVKCACGYSGNIQWIFAKSVPKETGQRSSPVPRGELAGKMLAGARARAGLIAPVPGRRTGR